MSRYDTAPCSAPNPRGTLISSVTARIHRGEWAPQGFGAERGARLTDCSKRRSLGRVACAADDIFAPEYGPALLASSGEVIPRAALLNPQCPGHARFRFSSASRVC